ncbi:Serine-type carboxypeptidase F [Penicillium diatomitis]|uniref:Carboxypeptidase n=1 Tax=Penicillium diatomitis TaxID=2819901 RepID=A0A9W9XGX0_9EURO|nr:Serine-type carboxypeptidase F [Penicillium diatomitis]KAJ5492674.1 Serine-type carboxypeptidase F [Penicillium diatomitis]
MFFRSILTSALALSLGFETAAASKHGRFAQLARDPLERAQRAADAAHVKPVRSHKGYRFLNKETKHHLVSHLPDVPYDIGEMYSGLMPIDKNNESRALFYIFQPTIGKPVDEVTIWLNGGPGCSSMEGFLQENGRFTWLPGTYAPVENQYSWVNLTNMLWVDQPVGTGFSIGTPTATTQEETAQEFVKFFQNFQELYGVKNFKVFVTGESYAGRYVPYISSALLDANITLGGALAYDPCIGQFDYVQEEIPAVPFVQQNKNLFNFNETFMAELERLHKECGYEEFIDTYLKFPPPKEQPPLFFNYTSMGECDVFSMIYNEALGINPCWDLYEVNQMCPLAWDVLAFPTSLVYLPKGASVYFDRKDVKHALHAPNVTWAECSNAPVYVGGSAGPEQEGDTAANPIEHVLPKVIEATNRVLIGNGDFDFVIITNGTLMAIQNMTWNGQLGFQKEPSTPIDLHLPDLQWKEVYAENGATGLDGGQGIMGLQHYERGLMWVQTYQSGHMQPQYQPRSSYRHLEWLLGHTEQI